MRYAYVITMAKQFLILILLLPIITTCSYRWVAHPQHVKDYEKCQIFNSGPQMLKVPGYDRSYIMVHDCYIMDRQRVSIGITIFLEEWGGIPKMSFQQGLVEAVMNDILVEFSDVKKRVNGYDATGKYMPNVAISGLAIGPTQAWVRTEQGDLLCETSFAHELVHIAIWAIKRTDGDPDHLGTKYSGWTTDHTIVIQNTNRRLCTLGI